MLAVDLGLPVASQQDERGHQNGQDAHAKRIEDEWVGVEVVEERRDIDSDPETGEDDIDADEGPGSDEVGHAVCSPLPERPFSHLLFMMDVWVDIPPNPGFSPSHGSMIL